MTTVGEALTVAKRRVATGEARLLLGHVLGRDLAWLIAHDDFALEGEPLRRFASLVSRRLGGEPIAYLTGHREFYGRTFAVDPDVLIPRPETELLVECAIAWHAQNYRRGGAAIGSHASPRVLDLGTGSGCVAISIALALPQAQVTAVDQSDAALAVARRNAEAHGARVRLVASDWFGTLVGERFDLIVGNPPYVAESDPHLAQGDLRFEPGAALASGIDGLDALRVITRDAPAFLAPGGWLWLEHGYDQAAQVRALLDTAGLRAVASRADLAGIERVSGGQEKSGPGAA